MQQQPDCSAATKCDPAARHSISVCVYAFESKAGRFFCLAPACGPPQAAAALPATTPCCCAAWSCPTVASGTNVGVTCTRPPTGWPTTAFTVTLTATAGLTGCTRSNAALITIRVPQPPALQGPATHTICAAAGSFSSAVSYSITASGAYTLAATASVAGITCTPIGGSPSLLWGPNRYPECRFWGLTRLSCLSFG